MLQLLLSEAKYGAGRGVPNSICFALGPDGGGIVIDHRLYKGTHGMAGKSDTLLWRQTVSTVTADRKDVSNVMPQQPE